MESLVYFGVALAQENATKGAQPSVFETLVIPLAFFFLIMYFLLIRPQSKKAKEHANMMNNLKSGDEVVTTGGLIGRIKSISDTFVTIDVTANTAVKVLKSHISATTKPKEAKKTSKKD